MDERIDQHSLAAHFGVTTRTIRAWVSDGTIPPPTRLGRTQFWLKGDFDQWIRRLSARNMRTITLPRP